MYHIDKFAPICILATFAHKNIYAFAHKTAIFLQSVQKPNCYFDHDRLKQMLCPVTYDTQPLWLHQAVHNIQTAVVYPVHNIQTAVI